MDRASVNCVHCNYPFDVNNLKTERRRHINTLQLGIDLIKVLSYCYDICEQKLRPVFHNDNNYVCASCFNTLKAISVCHTKDLELLVKIKSSVSSGFRECVHDLRLSETDNDIQHEQEPTTNYDLGVSFLPSTSSSTSGKRPRNLPSTSGKRPRNQDTPSKSGCTPRGKRSKAPSTTTRTPTKNRRQLLFSKATVVNVQSPGPKVKVHIGFNTSLRTTTLQGHAKLACRAIVMKQYKTAMNHLLQIQDAKTELSTVMTKTVNKEIQNLCSKESVFRSSNISKFSWTTAYRQIQSSCPVVLDILQTICGKKVKQTPRIISSMGVLLFTRNQQMNSIQAINSVMMFRGHVRTKVYSTFNKAGFCNSYKSTINTIDKICKDFDLPVKIWSKEISSQTQQTSKYTTTDDHGYAGKEVVTSDVHVMPTQESSTIETPDISTQEALSVSTPTTENPEEDLPMYTAEAIQSPVSVPQSTPTANQSSVQSMESPFTTTTTEAISDSGSFQIIMDNLNLIQKTPTQDTRHWEQSTQSGPFHCC